MIADLPKSSKAPLKKLILVALLLGMMVMMLVPNAFVVSSPYKLRVKGKEDYQRVYILKGEKDV